MHNTKNANANCGHTLFLGTILAVNKLLAMTFPLMND